ncbi:MAG: hypothetical protein ACI89U_000415 [Gammaproteobacteria bacterium]
MLFWPEHRGTPLIAVKKNKQINTNPTETRGRIPINAFNKSRGFDMKKYGLWIYDAYQYIFDSSKNPLRHIPDPVSRMFIMTILAFMWSGAFATYLGSIIYFGLSIAAHIVLILMFFFTVAVFYDAEKNQSSWLLRLRREQG